MTALMTPSGLGSSAIAAVPKFQSKTRPTNTRSMIFLPGAWHEQKRRFGFFLHKIRLVNLLASRVPTLRRSLNRPVSDPSRLASGTRARAHAGDGKGGKMAPCDCGIARDARKLVARRSVRWESGVTHPVSRSRLRRRLLKIVRRLLTGEQPFRQ